MGYEILDHTADVRVRVRGGTLAGLFRSAALAAAGLLTGGGGVGRSGSVTFEVSADTPEELLVRMLGEIIYIHSTRKMVFSDARVELDESAPVKARCTLRGEPYDPGRHELRYDLKGATYHDLKIRRVNDRFMAEIVFDV